MRDEKLNIVTVYWKGNFQKRQFKDSDVDLLKKSVDKHIDVPYNFYCLTNAMDGSFGGEKIKLLHNWPGWWSKMELFRPDLPEGKFLFIDLDSSAVGDLKPFFNYEDLTLTKPSVKKRRENGEFGEFEKEGIIWKYRSGVMVFRSRHYVWLYYQFREDYKKYMKMYRGDQDFIAHHLPNQPTFPSEWILKLKWVINKGKMDENTKILTGRYPDSRGQFDLPDKLEKRARG